MLNDVQDHYDDGNDVIIAIIIIIIIDDPKADQIWKLAENLSLYDLLIASLSLASVNMLLV